MLFLRFRNTPTAYSLFSSAVVISSTDSISANKAVLLVLNPYCCSHSTLCDEINRINQ